MLKDHQRRVYSILFVILVVSILLVMRSNCQLVLTKYEIDAGFLYPVRIVHLTDLHNRRFGDDNCYLVDKVLEQNPDLIVMTGDMINADEEDNQTIIDLIKRLSDRTPVYYSMGNHELAYQDQIGDQLSDRLTNAGATVLNYEYKDTVVNNNTIRIGGYYGYYRATHMITNNKSESEIVDNFPESFEDTTEFKLLLCHIPTPWLDWDKIDDYQVDLILCGHYHGGQVRIPFIGGLYAPYVGWFPKYTKGLFAGNKATCVLSTGLGSEIGVRINNPPEIVVIDLK